MHVMKMKKYKQPKYLAATLQNLDAQTGLNVNTLVVSPCFDQKLQKQIIQINMHVRINCTHDYY